MFNIFATMTSLLSTKFPTVFKPHSQHLTSFLAASNLIRMIRAPSVLLWIRSEWGPLQTRSKTPLIATQIPASPLALYIASSHVTIYIATEVTSLCKPFITRTAYHSMSITWINNLESALDVCIHSKSEKVCGVCFSVTKNLRKKCVNLNIKISR